MRRALLVVLAVLSACARRETETVSRDAPVIVISIDTLRADHLPLYGYKNVTTPAIDALARDGVVFDYAVSQCPLTLPSHVSMLTGLLPSTNGVRNNLGFRYDASKFVSLPQTLKQHGYATGAAVSSYVLRGETGLRDAFEFYDDSVEQRAGVNASEYQRGGASTAAVLEKWLDSVGQKPFFAFFHLYEPHAPYTPPEPFRSQFAPYDGEIAYADQIVGNFIEDLKRRGIYDRAIVVLMSDHGEGLGDHGEQQHGALLYIEELRVPLIIKLPKNARAGTRIGSHAALVDLMPTIEKLVGLAPQKTDGVDLFASVPSRDIYSETIYPYLQLGWSDERSLIGDRFHYIHATKPEMYDIASDPREQKNVLADNRRDAARLRDEVAKFPPPTEGNATIDAEGQAKLAALGYVGSVRANPGNGPLPNPRDEVTAIDAAREAYALADKGDYAAALPRLQAIVAKSPRFVDVWIRIAEINEQLGRLNEAIEAYKQAIAAAGPLSSDIVADLGYVYFEAGKLDDAQHAAEIAMAGTPRKAMALQVRVAGTKGDLGRAERIAQQLTSRPDATAADLLLLAEVEVARGKLDDALKMMDRIQTPTYGLEALRAEVLFKMHRVDEAIAADQREIAKFPHNGAAYTHLASVQYVSGHREDAQATLELLVRENPSPAAYDAAARTMMSVGDRAAARAWQARRR